MTTRLMKSHRDKKQGQIQLCLSKTSVLGCVFSNKQVPSLKIELQRSISLALGASPPLSQSASLKTRLIRQITVKAEALRHSLSLSSLFSVTTIMITAASTMTGMISQPRLSLSLVDGRNKTNGQPSLNLYVALGRVQPKYLCFTVLL